MRRTKKQQSLHKKKTYKKISMRKHMFRGGTFSDKQIREFRDVFSSFDKKGDGYISMKDLDNVIKSLGQNPTKDELNDIIRVFSIKKKRIYFGDFLSIMSIQMNNYNTELDTILKPYKEFDIASSGIISANDFRRIMKSSYDSLSDKDINDIIQSVSYPTVHDEQINYEDFFKKLLFNSGE